MKRNVSALLALVAITASCSDGTSTDPMAEASGTYTLATVNGAPVPYTVSTSATVVSQLVSATVVLTTAGAFTSTTVVRVTTNGTPTTSSESTSGTWTRSNATITFHNPADNTDTVVSYASGSLTATITGLTLVYRK